MNVFLVISFFINIVFAATSYSQIVDVHSSPLYNTKVSADQIHAQEPTVPDTTSMRHLPEAGPSIGANPELIPQLDSFYYYAEKGFFNFATSSRENYSLYSYKIEVESTDVYSGSGPIVIIDSLTNNINYVGKTIKIKGYYNKSDFQYYNPATQNYVKSAWSVLIKAPDSDYLEYYGNWTTGALKEGAIVIDLGNPEVNTIKFSYLVLKKDSYIIIPPKLESLTVESIPDNILSTKHPQVAYGKIWSSFVVEPNQTFLSSLQGLRNISLSISFTDQFGVRHRRNLNATVYYKK
jgi:hypothetical protein